MAKACALIALTVMVISCDTGTPEGPQGPWPRTEFLLQQGIESSDEKPDWISDSAWADLDVLRAADSRLGGFHVMQMTLSSDDRREATVRTTFDSWTTTFRVLLERRDGAWSLEAIQDLPNIKYQLQLTGSDGLPFVNQTTLWNEGLTGIDSSGRPNTSVLIQIMEDDLKVDGRSLRERSEKSVREAIRTAFEEREKLSAQAKATYRRHIALAVPKTANCGEVIDIIQWAGTEGSALTQLLVKTENGPGWLPLGHTQKMPGSVPIQSQISGNNSGFIVTDLSSGRSTFASTSALREAVVKTIRTPLNGGRSRVALRIALGRTQGYDRLISVVDHVMQIEPDTVIVIEALE